MFCFFGSAEISVLEYRSWYIRSPHARRCVRKCARAVACANASANVCANVRIENDLPQRESEHDFSNCGLKMMMTSMIFQFLALHCGAFRRQDALAYIT